MNPEGDTSRQEILVTTHLLLDDLVYGLARKLTNDQLRAFVLELDRQVADCDFTEGLIQALQADLDKEGE